MSKGPTIRSLAKQAGVSTATVSLALRNHPRIRPEQRRRIQKIAEEAGYRANPLVANLLAQLRASNTTGYKSTLGLVFLGGIGEMLKIRPTFHDWVTGCHERAHSLGYGLDEFSFPGAIGPRRLAQILHTRNINGLVLMGPLNHHVIPPPFRPLVDARSCVVIGTRPLRPALTFASNDQFLTALEAFQKVMERGYRRPGLCLMRMIDEWVDYRFSEELNVQKRRSPRATVARHCILTRMCKPAPPGKRSATGFAKTGPM